MSKEDILSLTNKLYSSVALGILGVGVRRVGSNASGTLQTVNESKQLLTTFFLKKNLIIIAEIADLL